MNRLIRGLIVSTLTLLFVFLTANLASNFNYVKAQSPILTTPTRLISMSPMERLNGVMEELGGARD